VTLGRRSARPHNPLLAPDGQDELVQTFTKGAVEPEVLNDLCERRYVARQVCRTMRSGSWQTLNSFRLQETSVRGIFFLLGSLHIPFPAELEGHNAQDANLHNLESSKNFGFQVFHDSSIDPSQVKQQRHHSGTQLVNSTCVLNAFLSKVFTEGCFDFLGGVAPLVVPASNEFQAREPLVKERRSRDLRGHGRLLRFRPNVAAI